MTARLNDRLRKTGRNGDVILSLAVSALPLEDQLEIFLAIQMFDAFTVDTDPAGDHRRGIVEAAGKTVLWEIDDHGQGSRIRLPQTIAPVLPRRVMTIMLAEEHGHI
ncbi:DUF3768 domain-containing protein [Blastomonas sp.]|uniref:DUF3768 domain-containing protein n=1 Tax=Blastomonas sp. TaxID=1909299 RepID=UPI0018350C48|nr:DUF3768 domain-containing protein [Blastomonas sp.]